MPHTYTPTLPGVTGTNSSFRSLSVLVRRSGIRDSPTRAGKSNGRGHRTAPAPAKDVREGLTVEDLLQVRLVVVLVHALRERQLLDEEVAGGVEHLPLAEREVLVELEQVQVAEDLGDLEHGARLDLLHVLAIATVPGSRVDGDVLLLQDPVDHDDRLLVDERAQADRADLVDGDEDLHPVFHDFQYIERLALAGDVLVLDAHYLADTLPRVDGLVADLESLHRHAFYHDCLAASRSCLTVRHDEVKGRLLAAIFKSL